MTPQEAVANVRAMQMLDDPALPVGSRVPNGSQLLRQLAANVKGRADLLQSVLNEISDLRVREAMRVALLEITG